MFSLGPIWDLDLTHSSLKGELKDRFDYNSLSLQQNEGGCLHPFLTPTPHATLMIISVQSPKMMCCRAGTWRRDRLNAGEVDTLSFMLTFSSLLLSLSYWEQWNESIFPDSPDSLAQNVIVPHESCSIRGACSNFQANSWLLKNPHRGFSVVCSVHADLQMCKSYWDVSANWDGGKIL